MTTTGIPIVTPVAMQTATFPIPVNIQFSALGLPSSAESYFMDAARNIDGRFGYRNGTVTPVLAFRVQRMFHFGRKVADEFEAEVYHAVNDAFFGGASFYRKDGEVQPVRVRLRATDPFADGDTAKITHFWNGKKWMKYRKNGVSVRMDGIDTPESNRSGKQDGHVKYISKYLAEEHGVGNTQALQDLVRARLVYVGKLSSVVANAFGEHFAGIGIRLAPAYTLKAKESAFCDTLDPWDKYGRLIGRILAGGDNQGEDLLAGFIQSVLPGAMRGHGEGCLQEYLASTDKHASLLSIWKRTNSDLYDILGREGAPKAGEVFSGAQSASLAEMWTGFTSLHSRAKNDLQTMMAFLGVGAPYPKYRGHLTEMDLAAEQYALGGVPAVSSGHGLYSDPIFHYVRPIVNDAFPSPVFQRYGTKMTSIRSLAELDPPDCRGLGTCALPG